MPAKKKKPSTRQPRKEKPDAVSFILGWLLHPPRGAESVFGDFADGFSCRLEIEPAPGVTPSIALRHGRFGLLPREGLKLLGRIQIAGLEAGEATAVVEEDSFFVTLLGGSLAYRLPLARPAVPKRKDGRLEQLSGAVDEGRAHGRRREMRFDYEESGGCILVKLDAHGRPHTILVNWHHSPICTLRLTHLQPDPEPDLKLPLAERQYKETTFQALSSKVHGIIEAKRKAARALETVAAGARRLMGLVNPWGSDER